MKRLFIVMLLVFSLALPVKGEDAAFLSLPEIPRADDIMLYARDLMGLDIPKDAKWIAWENTEETQIYRCEFYSINWQQNIVLIISATGDGWTSIQLLHRTSPDGEEIPPRDAKDLDIQEKIDRFSHRLDERIGSLPEIPSDTKILYESGLSLSNYFQDQETEASEWRWNFTLVLDGDGDFAYDDKVISIYWDPALDELAQVIVSPFSTID